VVQRYKEYKNSDLSLSKVLSRSSKFLSFISLHRLYKRHAGTIFYTTTFQALSAIHKHSYNLTTLLGITQDNSNQLKKASHKAPTTSQWRGRWFMDSLFLLHIQHLSTMMTYCFLRLFMVRIFHRATDQGKGCSQRSLSCQTLLQGKPKPSLQAKTL
jgi:hypothetical protein